MCRSLSQLRTIKGVDACDNKIVISLKRYGYVYKRLPMHYSSDITLKPLKVGST
ncbi:TPA: hypothetical protein P5J91_000321 [Legionella pneumophila]|nr:hypothetical protein [Legionella pneumophila]